MKRMLGVFLVLPWLSGPTWSADDKAMAVVEKAIKAMGGQERFEKAQTTFLKFSSDEAIANGASMATLGQMTAQGLENFRLVFELDGDGSHRRTSWVFNGDQCWLQNSRRTVELKPHQVRDTKQSMLARYLPTRPDLLKSKVFDLELAGEQVIGGRPTVAIKVSGLGLVGMKIYFDRERGLPVKSEAIVSSPRGDHLFERVFSDYRELEGIQVATKIECKRRSADVVGASVEHIKEFKILDKVPADTFTEPK